MISAMFITILTNAYECVQHMSDDICLGYRGQEESGFDKTWSKSTINRNASTDLKEFRRKTETIILVLNKYRRSYAHSRGYPCSRGYLRTMRCICAITCNSYTLAQYVRPHVDPLTKRPEWKARSQSACRLHVLEPIGLIQQPIDQSAETCMLRIHFIPVHQHQVRLDLPAIGAEVSIDLR